MNPSFNAILTLKMYGLHRVEFASLVSMRAASDLVSAIWQGAALAICVWLCLKLAPRTTAGLRFVIWASTFSVATLIPLLGYLPQTASSVAGPVSSARGPWLHLDVRWSLVLTSVWVAVGLYRAACLIIHGVRLRQLWQTAMPVSTRGHDGFQLPIKSWRSAELCTTRGLDRPSVIGFLRPRILIPEWLYDQLSPAELEQIVLHETEHLRRGDDWSNLLQKLCLIAFPLNPVLLWMERRLCIEREMACDEGVVRITHAPRAYASVLARLAERGLTRGTAYRSEALSLGFDRWSRRSELVLRVHSILFKHAVLSPLVARGFAATLIVGLLAGSVELSRSPQLVAFVPMVSSAEMGRVGKLESPLHEAVPVHGAPQTVAMHGEIHRRKTETRASVFSQQTPDTDPRYIPAKLNVAPHSLREEWRHAEVFDASQTNVAEPANLALSSERAAFQAPESGWIIVTHWEEAVTTAPLAQDTIDAGPSGARMLFKMVTARVSSQHYAAVPTRNGWLVFQL